MCTLDSQERAIGQKTPKIHSGLTLWQYLSSRRPSSPSLSHPLTFHFSTCWRYRRSASLPTSASRHSSFSYSHRFPFVAREAIQALRSQLLRPFCHAHHPVRELHETSIERDKTFNICTREAESFVASSAFCTPFKIWETPCHV